jgi:hypothetical protein
VFVDLIGHCHCGATSVSLTAVTRFDNVALNDADVHFIGAITDINCIHERFARGSSYQTQRKDPEHH